MNGGEQDDDSTSLYDGLVEDLGDLSLAKRAWEGIRERFGGQRVYVRAPDREARNAAIRERYNGRNRDEICREFGVSEAALYRIVGNRK